MYFLSSFLFVCLLKFIYLFNLFILAVLGLRCCAWAFSNCSKQELLFIGVWASHCGGFSCCRARALGAWASVVVACGLSSCGSRALEHRFSSCGARAQLLRGMWDPPRPGIEPVFPALAGGFSTTAPPGKPLSSFQALVIVFLLSGLQMRSSKLGIKVMGFRNRQPKF